MVKAKQVAGDKKQSAGGKAIQKSSGKGGEAMSADKRYRMVSEAAYYIAEKRGFDPDYNLQNWLQAEQELKL